jgi:hypothetical protein
MVEEKWDCGLEEKDELRIGTGCGSPGRLGVRMRWVGHGLLFPPRLDGTKCCVEGDVKKVWSDERGG